MMIFELDSGVAPWSLPWQRLRAIKVQLMISTNMVLNMVSPVMVWVGTHLMTNVEYTDNWYGLSCYKQWNNLSHHTY